MKRKRKTKKEYVCNFSMFCRTSEVGDPSRRCPHATKHHKMLTLLMPEDLNLDCTKKRCEAMGKGWDKKLGYCISIKK